jgi:surface protein
MSQMFAACSALTTVTNIDQWDVSSIENMSQMFTTSASFNQSLDGWGSKTSKVKNMNSMFYGATAFNQPLADWDVSSVTDMGSMFAYASTFNQPLESWDVSSVTNMSSMFNQASAFNQPLENWNVSSVTDMSSMFFFESSFNQPLNKWLVSNVTTTAYMFFFATSFKQTLGAWDLRNMSIMTNMFDGSLDCGHYSGTLIGWANNLGYSTPSTNITLGAAGLQYSASAAGAHANLVAAGWTFTDAGQGGCTAILPVNIKSFTVQPQNNTALLQWTTASETNNKGFSIQRSADGATWADLSFVNSQASGGNSTAEITYQYTDNNPLAGNNYYRLKQVDLSGAVSYSEVLGLNFNNLATTLRVSPNPANTHIKISNLPTNATVRIVSITGSVYTLPVDNGNIDVSSLSPGTYFVQVIVSNSLTGTLKFVKQ